MVGAFSRLGQFLANESPIKMLKNAFYFTFKVISFSRYLNFCLDFLVMYKNGLIRKIRLISKFMTSQPRKETTAIHILPYISGSKDNQTMKFGQLIKSNMRNIFLETSYPNMVRKLVPDPFLKNQN